MREIKYRAWNKEENRWATHNEQLSDVNVSATVKMPSIMTVGSEKYDLQQYTGLKDKNGQEIYEGDVVKITGEMEWDCGHSCDLKDNAVVVWNENECLYELAVIRKREVHFSDFEAASIEVFSLRKWSEEEWDIEYEVIGNIHNNPELLERSNEHS